MAKTLKATHQGNLKIANVEIPAFVLEDGRRLISQNGLQRALGMSLGGGTQGERRVSALIAKISNQGLNLEDLAMQLNNPIIFYPEFNGRSVYGFEATILADLCESILEARDKQMLLPSQQRYAKASEIMMRSLAKVGIIALVDEATGYEKDRERGALQKLLERILEKEHGKWIKTFPDEFFETIYKMRGWDWKQATKGQKPGVIGTYINDFVWSRLAPSVLKELNERNPVTEKGYRKYKHPQFLNVDHGHPLLKEHLASVIALGKASGHNWKNFQRLINRAFPKYGDTIEIPFEEVQEIE